MTDQMLTDAGTRRNGIHGSHLKTARQLRANYLSSLVRRLVQSYRRAVEEYPRGYFIRRATSSSV